MCDTEYTLAVAGVRLWNIYLYYARWTVYHINRKVDVGENSFRSFPFLPHSLAQCGLSFTVIEKLSIKMCVVDSSILSENNANWMAWPLWEYSAKTYLTQTYQTHLFLCVIAVICFLKKNFARERINPRVYLSSFHFVFFLFATRNTEFDIVVNIIMVICRNTSANQG